MLTKKLLNQKSKKRKEVPICPKCESFDVIPDTESIPLRGSVMFKGIEPHAWLCRKCKYVGLMPFKEISDDGLSGSLPKKRIKGKKLKQNNL